MVRDFNEIKKFINLFNETASNDNPVGRKKINVGTVSIYCDKVEIFEGDNLFFKKDGEIIAIVFIPYTKESLWFTDCNDRNHELRRQSWVMR